MRKHIRLAAALSAAGAIALALPAQKSSDAATGRNLSTFNAIVKELTLNYVDTINPDRAFGEAIGAFLATVDPYTEYYTADDQEQLKKMTTGDYGGIGSYILERDGATYISGPMEGSPSLEAGLKPGDHIIRVDSTDTSRMPSEKVTKLLRGVPGTTVHVEVVRPYVADSLLSFDLVRRQLHTPSVGYAGMLPDSTGYIYLTSFIDKTPREFKEALEEIRRSGEPKRLVLDLRGNGGGLLESAVDVLGYFLPKGTEVLRTRGRDPKSEKIYKTTHSPIYPDIPLAVLVDGSTASASEIVAGAIQDLDRGVLVGNRSFGKGLVQSTRPLPYSGVLKVTVAKYYTPSGRLIQAIDYGKRNEDGSVQRVPDSLTHEYKTLHGRTIRDGGGLQPDSVVEYPKPSRLVYNAVRDNWVFDFANKFASTHPSISSPADFVISDSIYSDFKASIDPAKFKYDRVIEESLENLREIAKVEGYEGEEIDSTFNKLSTLFTHNLDRDLDIHREHIESYLAPEIVSRYYNEKGRVRSTLNDDPGLAVALAILRDPALYRRFLEPKK